MAQSPSESYRIPIELVIFGQRGSTALLCVQPPPPCQSGGELFGGEMKPASVLGESIQTALDQDDRFQLYREPIQYLTAYKTRSGQVFAIERQTQNQIRLWFPLDEKARVTAEQQGLIVQQRSPYPNSANPTHYGRISSLKSVPELRDAILYTTAVSSAEQAIAILGALQ